MSAKAYKAYVAGLASGKRDKLSATEKVKDIPANGHTERDAVLRRLKERKK